MGHVETLRCSHRWLTKPRFYWIWSKGTVRVRAQLKEKRILAQVKKPSHYVYLSTVYSCGLRRQEGLKLTVADIDSDRKLLAIRQSKGAKDRYVPLPQATLKLLRSIGNSMLLPILRSNFSVACGSGTYRSLAPLLWRMASSLRSLSISATVNFSPSWRRKPQE